MAARLLAASLFVLPLAGFGSSYAQDYGAPPPGPGYGDESPDYGGREPVDTPDAGGLSIRLSKLESRIREMTGQIEELQNANRKLIEQVQRFQDSVDARLSAGGSRQRHAEAEAPKAVDNGRPTDTDGAASKPRKPRRDDAYDPDAAGGDDPGKPKALGSAASAQPDDGGNAPMDLSGGRLRSGDANGDTLAPTLRLPSATPRQAGGTVTPNGTIIANANPAAGVPNSPRAEFDTALGLYRDKQYEDAEKGFTAFIRKNPKSKLAADATYYLGESFAQRGRSREAAEQYLKISTDYANSTRAPDAMLHLGMSLKQLGAKEQACATFTEVTRKYPNAPAYVKSGAEREAKRAQC